MTSSHRYADHPCRLIFMKGRLPTNDMTRRMVLKSTPLHRWNNLNDSATCNRNAGVDRLRTEGAAPSSCRIIGSGDQNAPYFGVSHVQSFLITDIM